MTTLTLSWSDKVPVVHLGIWTKNLSVSQAQDTSLKTPIIKQFSNYNLQHLKYFNCCGIIRLPGHQSHSCFLRLQSSTTTNHSQVHWSFSIVRLPMTSLSSHFSTEWRKCLTRAARTSQGSGRFFCQPSPSFLCSWRCPSRSATASRWSRNTRGPSFSGWEDSRRAARPAPASFSSCRASIITGKVHFSIQRKSFWLRMCETCLY